MSDSKVILKDQIKNLLLHFEIQMIVSLTENGFPAFLNKKVRWHLQTLESNKMRNIIKSLQLSMVL